MNKSAEQPLVPDPEPPSTGTVSPEDTKPLQANRSLVPLEKSDIKGEGSSVFSWLLRLFGRRKNGSTIREDLADALSDDEGLAQGFSPEERAMLTSILHLQDKRGEDIMVPRADIIAVSDDISLAELLKIFETSGHSRMPVYDDTLDDPQGMVHIRDVLNTILKISKQSRAEIAKRRKKLPENLDLKKVDLSKPIKSMKLVREVMFVPPSMGARELMARMQAERMQIALVIDEYGGTDGLVSLEDIVEEVVGEIEDEHDEDEGEENQIVESGDGVWTVDARVEVEKLAETIGSTFDPGESAEDVDSLGGLVFALAGHIPVRGEVVRGVPGFEFRVMDADPRRIRRVQVVQISQREKRRRAASKLSEDAG